jgi:hypothetical protein
VYAQFDLDAFFELAKSQGIELSWITGKKAEAFKQFSVRIPGSPNAWGIRAVLPDGSEQTLLSGFVARVLHEETTPKHLLTLIRNPIRAHDKPDERKHV